MNFGVVRRCAALLLIAVPALGVAQSLGDSLAKRTVNVEFGGPGGLSSFNYEQSVRRQTFARIGFAKWSMKALLGGGQWQATTVTAGASRVFDIGSLVPSEHGTWIELGLNATAGRHSYSQTDMLMGPQGREAGPYAAVNGEFGIRFQGAGKGVSSRFMFSPAYVIRRSVSSPDRTLQLGAGVSIGFAF